MAYRIPSDPFALSQDTLDGTPPGRRERVVTVAATVLGVLVVALIAVLMGMA